MFGPKFDSQTSVGDEARTPGSPLPSSPLSSIPLSSLDGDINYGKVHTVENNVKVKYNGNLDSESRKLLREKFENERDYYDPDYDANDFGYHDQRERSRSRSQDRIAVVAAAASEAAAIGISEYRRRKAKKEAERERQQIREEMARSFESFQEFSTHWRRHEESGARIEIDQMAFPRITSQYGSWRLEGRPDQLKGNPWLSARSERTNS